MNTLNMGKNKLKNSVLLKNDNHKLDCLIIYSFCLKNMTIIYSKNFFFERIQLFRNNLI